MWFCIFNVSVTTLIAIDHAVHHMNILDLTESCRTQEAKEAQGRERERKK